MGLFTVSLAKQDRELLRELIRLVKAVRNQELVIHAHLKDRDVPSVDVDFGIAGTTTTTFSNDPDGN